jgi:hypothetical protein
MPRLTIARLLVQQVTSPDKAKAKKFAKFLNSAVPGGRGKTRRKRRACSLQTARKRGLLAPRGRVSKKGLPKAKVKPKADVSNIPDILL